MRLILLLVAIASCTTFALGRDLPTAEVAIVGRFARGPIDFAVEVDQDTFTLLFSSGEAGTYAAETQARQFFRNGGDKLSVVRLDPQKSLAEAMLGSLLPPRLSGLGALLPLSNLGLLVCPELTTLPDPALDTCLQRLEALGREQPLFTLLDPPPTVTTDAELIAWRRTHLPSDLAFAAVYFPQLTIDPATWGGGASAIRLTAGASGTMAAVIRRSDARRKIWKSPAGTSATFLAEGLTASLTENQLESLNVEGISSLRDLPSSGLVAWGARTLDITSENRYIPVARTRRWIVRSLERELTDASLEPDGTALWNSLRLRSELFLSELYLAGALIGASKDEAYFVRCDSTTTTATDIAANRVNVLLGFSLLRPAEFSVDTVVLGTLDTSTPVPEVPVLVSPPISGSIILAYPTSPGFQHSLQSSGVLAAAAWFDGGARLGDGTWIRQLVPTTDARRFFRVKTVTGW